MTLHKYPHVLAGDRKSATALFEGATPALAAAQSSRRLPDRLRWRLGRALASQVDALPDDGYIDRRETIRRFIGLACWDGRLRPSTTRIRTKVALMAIESRDCGHPNGPFLLNVTQLAKDCGYSRQAVWDALRPLKSPSYKGTPKLVRWQSPMKSWGSWPSLAPAPGTGNRRPGFWALRPDLWVSEQAHSYGVSAVSVNSHKRQEIEDRPGSGGVVRGAASPSRREATAKDKDAEIDRKTPCAGAGPRRELHAVPSETTHAEQLTRWLSNADLDRLPTDAEKRKLSQAIRLLVSPSVGEVCDSLLNALWWRRYAPLRLWSDVVTELQNEALIGPDIGDPTRWSLALLKRLSTPAAKPPPAEVEVEPQELARIERRIAGADRRRVLLENERARMRRAIAGARTDLEPSADSHGVRAEVEVEADLSPVYASSEWLRVRVHRRAVEADLSPDGLAVLSFIRGYRPRHVPVKIIETCVALSESVTLHGRDGVLTDLRRRGLIEAFNSGRCAYITAAGREALPPDPRREANREAKSLRAIETLARAHRQAVEAVT